MEKMLLLSTSNFIVFDFQYKAIFYYLFIKLQSTLLNRVTSVRGHFAPIKRRTLLTENILYLLLCVRAIPVLPKVA